MAQTDERELVDRFEQFYRNYYREAIGDLAQQYPNERRSLHIDWQDLYQFDPDIADDYIAQPDQLREYAEEALRLYDLPIDVSLGQAHVRIENLSDKTEIRDIRSRDVNTLVSVQGIIRKATDVRPKVEEAAFECQRCGTLTYIPQTDGSFQEPHECQGCERQGPFRINYDQSTFVDAQKLRVQESPEGLRGGETPQNIDVNIEDDITGKVTPGDHVTVTGALRIEQQESGGQKSRLFDVYMDGHSLTIEDEEFEDMDITEADRQAIIELSQAPDLYQQMVDSIAPSIYGYENIKLAIALQLFSGVTKHLPDESRIRGDMHMLLIGDPGTGKCVKYDTNVTLSDGTKQQIGELVEAHLDDPIPVDDGVYQPVDFEVLSVQSDGTVAARRATKVWKREAPERMYRIRTTNGRELEVTPSHPLFVHSMGTLKPTRADELAEGAALVVPNQAVKKSRGNGSPERIKSIAGNATKGTTFTDGGHVQPVENRNIIETDRIESIQTVKPDYRWVYDLEVADTHNYLANGVLSHNSQLLQYIRNIAPRSVYTSGKGSSSAGLTAAAVRDDFGDGQQWTLEAGALVLADRGIAAIDELDKMRSEDRSALHEGLEQQQISISKAGINATLKSRCALLGAANPKYGRFDQYEPIAEQIDLEPALVSRFDLIFTVTDQPDEEEDRALAQHILSTNYAGEISTQRTQLSTPNVSEEELESIGREAEPAIGPELFRKYIAYAKRNCFPTLTDEAKAAIEDFYVDLRLQGTDEDAPVPVTARKLEALVRLAEASARIRLSDTVDENDAERAIDIVRSCLQDIGIDPETGQFDADVVETGTSKSQRDRIKNLLDLIETIEDEYQEGAPIEEVLSRADEIGMEQSKAEHEIEKLKRQGEVYEPSTDHLRTT
ncbi:MAG: ATP-binding protein [Halobacteriales archaeon]|nr:ATP-binding protein [Halobacteriales archaeon]